MYPSILFAATTLMTLAFASPAQEPRIQAPIGPLHGESAKQSTPGPLSCTIKLPTSYQQIARDKPTTSYPQANRFSVSQASGGAANVDTLLRFAGIRSGSFGCQLAMSFTFEYPINSTGSTLLNVFALPNDISPTDTYEKYFPNGGRGTPKGSFLWATTTITGQKQVVNSEVCRPSLGYLFQISSDTKAGAVEFLDAGNNLSGIGGFYMTYNC